MKSLLVLLCSATALAQMQTSYRPPILRAVGIDQKMGAQVPLDLPFTDDVGNPVTLRQYSGKPMVLALVYYACPSLCNMVLSGLVRSIKDMSLSAGRDFEIVAVSFDPRETREMAAAKKATYLKSYARPGAERGWHFLTGADASSKGLAGAVGFHYAYDPITNQYAHGSAIIVLTPEGRVSKYFYGIEYPERDLRLGLVEASNHRIGSPIDRVMLYCFHYDPSNGKYGMVIMNVLRLGGLLTVGTLALFMLVMFRRDFRQQKAI
ncbi:MAG TPA: SCO family protein [Bryobacteraceae bacterium]|nr:SCO family protein [Bryobacteraceae bacterium]